MKRRKIRSLSVSEIGMGCMGFSHGYGKYRTQDIPKKPFGKRSAMDAIFSIRQRDTGRNFIIPDITRKLSGVRSKAFAMRP